MVSRGMTWPGDRMAATSPSRSTGPFAWPPAWNRRTSRRGGISPNSAACRASYTAMAGPSPGIAGQTGTGTGTGQSMAMDENQVRELLRGQGYGDAQSVMRDGNNFRARVTRNGRPTDITIDAYTGTIRNQAARR